MCIAFLPYPIANSLAEVFPGVPLHGEIGQFETLLSIKKARKVLGYAPQYS
ncbi:MAG: hypothetical protein ACJ8DI_15135 [Ktedonobacteraceae bacterium]